MTVRMGSGPPNAPVMIVGEAFGENEERAGEPFVGASGMELNRMLHDAGIMRSDCYVTNVVNARPPANNIELWWPQAKSRVTSDMVQLKGNFVKPIFAAGYASLRTEIDMVKPRVIIAMGNAALWALADRRGILKWRGSLLRLDGDESKPRVVPTMHPAAVLRQWEWRSIVVMDLRRAKKELTAPARKPRFDFTIKPNLDTVMQTLSMLQSCVEAGPFWIDLDLETRAGHISCCGLAWSETQALCIPLMLRGSLEGYWLVEEEALIVHAVYRLLTHPNCWVRGQNLLYDAQYTYKHWHFIPNVKQDTMISHHTLWPGLKKSLDFQASMYCDYYVQWKPEKEVWKEGG